MRIRTIVIWGLVGCVVTVFWGIVGFIFFAAPQSVWTDIYWYAVYVTCPPWLLPETRLSWLVTPLLNAGLYAGLALAVRAVRQPSIARGEVAVKRTALMARFLLSLLGLVLIVLGALSWTGRALSLVPVHMLLGVLFVVCLWLLAALALFARAGRGPAVLVLVWSLIVLALGVAQLRLLPGSLHWLVQLMHLAVGLIAMGLGHAVARSILRGATLASAVRAHG